MFPNIKKVSQSILPCFVSISKLRKVFYRGKHKCYLCSFNIFSEYVITTKRIEFLILGLILKKTQEIIRISSNCKPI